MMNRLKEFIKSDCLEIHYKNNKLNIVNYDKIVFLGEEKIILLKNNQTINIKGENLTLLKLLDSEILIDGLIKQIEL